MSRVTLSPPLRLLGQLKIRTEERRHEKGIRREKFTVSQNEASRLIWEEKCRARWPSPLSIFPAPAIFLFPFPLPFSNYLAVSIGVELTPGREVSNDLTEHSRFRFPNSNVGLHRRCLPVAYPFFFLWRSEAVFLPSRTKKNSSRHGGTWQHDSGFKRLTRFRSRRISKLCKMKLFLSMTAGCERHSL